MKSKTFRLFLIIFGIGLGIEGLIVALFAYDYRNRIFPNTFITDIDVSGLTIPQALEKLTISKSLPQELVVTHQTQKWTIPLTEIKVQYQWENTISKAFLSERSLLKLPGRATVYIEPLVTWDKQKLADHIASISAEMDIPAQNPEVTISWGHVIVTSGENGQAVDQKNLLGQLESQIRNLTFAPIVLPLNPLTPKLDTTQMQNLKTRAESLVNKKISVSLDDELRNWLLEDAQLLSWMSSGGWKVDAIAAWIAELAQNVDREPQNASFRYINPNRVEEFKPGKPGLKIKQSELLDRLLAALKELEQTKTDVKILIPIESTEPRIKTSQVNSLGIRELIGRGESYFSGSIPNRIHNVKLAASLIDGQLIAPGETFSFVKAIGDISAASGYKTAYVIKDGRTVLGDGGGVCQVSSTLFRAALLTGLPIKERWAHAYRVHYYEENSQLGLDATIFSPSVDLKFENDTPGYILIQTELDEKNYHLVFNIYGTSDGRKASVSPSRTWGVTAPPPALYQDDPTLPAGRVVQVDWSAWGAKSSFDWKVTRGEEILQEKTFYSNYRPWQAVFLRGTKI